MGEADQGVSVGVLVLFAVGGEGCVVGPTGVAAFCLYVCPGLFFSRTSMVTIPDI